MANPTRRPLSAAWDRLRGAPATPTPAERPAPDAPLTDTERDILDFEARPWAQGGAKAREIRERYGWSETRYLQVLRSLLDRPAALEHAPKLVWRLREQVAAGRR